MKKQSHTPGPWKFSEETMRVFFVDRKNGEEPPICDMDVADIMAIEDFDVVIANARVITLAPDMLEALEEIERLSRYVEVGPAGRIADLCNNLIDRAKGKS